MQLSSINSAIEAVQGARLDWATNDLVYAYLGVALRSLRATQKKAVAQLRKSRVAAVQGRTLEQETAKWAAANPGAAGRADALTKLDDDGKRVLAALLDGPLSSSKLTRIARDSYTVPLLEKELRLIDFDGDEWNLTELGLEACKVIA